MSIERLEKVWPQWKIGDMIGEGSFGKVYKAMREEHGLTTYSAIKAISIPQNDAELNSLRSEGWSEGATRTYLKGIVDDFVNEIKMMESMKGTQNIVGVEDYQVLEKEDKIGWDIFIRMELLTSLVEHTSDKKLPEDEVIKLGLDLLGALELCSKKKVIHRDIKPENIFLSSFGHYKLGDFGIARELEKTAGSMSQKGTYNYIAPEVASGRHYDATVDSYSLGIVLYKLMNNNRLPFIDQTAQMVHYQDRKNALDKRLKGEPLPTPAEASHSLAQVILKACAFNPQDRYQSPEEFRQALEMVKAGQTVPDFSPTVSVLDSSATVSAVPMSTTGNPFTPATANTPPTSQVEHFGKKKSKKPLMVAVCAILLAVVGFGAFMVMNQGLGIFANDVDRVIAALAGQDYTEAAAIFSDARHDMDMDALENALSLRLDDLRDEFRDEAISYNAARMELNTISNWRLWQLDNQVEEVSQFLEMLNNSRVAFQVANAQYDSGDFLGAIDSFQLVSMDDANYDAARDGVIRAIEGYRLDALDRAAAYASRGNFQQAILVLDNTFEVVGNEAELARQRETYARQEVSRRIEAAQELASANNFAGAMNELRLLETEHPSNAEVTRAISSVESSHVPFVVERANTFASDGRFSDATRELNDALRIHPNNATLTATRNNIENTHITDIISQANEYAANERFEEALVLLNNGLRTYPGNADLISARDETQTREIDSLIAQANSLAAGGQFAEAINILENSRHRTTTLFRDLIAEYTLLMPRPMVAFFDNYIHFQSGGNTTIDTSNMLGNAYPNSLRGSSRSGGWRDYNINAERTTLTATVGRRDGTGTWVQSVSFIGDGALLASFNIAADTVFPYEIEVDLTGVHILRIQINDMGHWSAPSSGVLALTNVMIQ